MIISIWLISSAAIGLTFLLVVLVVWLVRYTWCHQARSKRRLELLFHYYNGRQLLSSMYSSNEGYKYRRRHNALLMMIYTILLLWSSCIAGWLYVAYV